MYHNALMKAVESDGGQEAEEFADFASRQTFPDGTNMLALLHNDNYIKKFKTNEIMVTYGNEVSGRILLNKLNEMIAKEKGKLHPVHIDMRMAIPLDILQPRCSRIEGKVCRHHIQVPATDRIGIDSGVQRWRCGPAIDIDQGLVWTTVVFLTS